MYEQQNIRIRIPLFKDQLRDYDYMTVRNEYEHITEYGDGPFQEYARYKFDKSDRRVPAEETGVSQMCDKMRKTFTTSTTTSKL